MIPDNKNSIKDLKKGAILDSLQNPITLGLITTCSVSLVFTFLVAPFTGGILVGSTIAGISGIAGAGSVIWNGFIKNEKYLESKAGEIEKNRKLDEERVILLKIKELENKLDWMKFVRGNKLYDSLHKEYAGLQSIFSEDDFNDTLIDVARIKRTTRDIYSKGLDLLNLAYRIYEQTDITDYNQMKNENIALNTDLKKYSATSDKYASIKEKIEKNTNIISLIKKNKDRVDELLMQSELCEDSIREIRLQLPELMAHKSHDELEKIILELNTRVEFAQRLQEEYNRQGI